MIPRSLTCPEAATFVERGAVNRAVRGFLPAGEDAGQLVWNLNLKWSLVPFRIED